MRTADYEDHAATAVIYSISVSACARLQFMFHVSTDVLYIICIYLHVCSEYIYVYRICVLCRGV
jgi:hypothetical protein